MIGVAITTYNRPEVIKRSYREWKRRLPRGAVLVVVDDGSDNPFKHADYVFPHNAGIAAAKNKCIELLMDAGCEHIFLADSDTYPIVDGWWRPYIDSGIKHLSFTFPSLSNGRDNGRKYKGEYRDGIAEYGSPCGCMLYIHRDVIGVIGGFDVDYPQWGFEHVDFSRRAFNAGMIPKPYLDIIGSISLFHSMDYYGEVSGSVAGDVKNKVIDGNRERFESLNASREYMPYRSAGDGVVLGAYFNSLPDPQRGIKWEADIDGVSNLIASCRRNGVPVKIFHDCLSVDDDEVFIRVPGPKHYAPNVYRWTVFREYLLSNRHDAVFMVDSTDVEVLRNPFLSINPNRLYVGDEYNMTVGNTWMSRHQAPLLRGIRDYNTLISRNRRKILPNCGIVGGAYDIAMEYLNYRVEYHEKHTHGVVRSTDMAMFNYIVWKHFAHRMTHGIKVNTRFKANEYNKISFFKHK